MGALDELTNKGLPIPSIYASESATADKAYQDALASIAQQQSGLAQKYGFNVSTDPNSGAFQGAEIDPQQQYSSVMNLLGNNASQLHNVREALSSRGLTGGGLKGLAAQRAALLKFQQQGQVAGLGSQFASQYGGLENQKAGALANKNQGYDSAARDAINFAISNGWFNPAPPVQEPFDFNSLFQQQQQGGQQQQNAGQPQTYDSLGVVPSAITQNMVAPPLPQQQVQQPQEQPQLQPQDLAPMAPLSEASGSVPNLLSGIQSAANVQTQSGFLPGLGGAIRNAALAGSRNTAKAPTNYQAQRNAF